MSTFKRSRSSHRKCSIKKLFCRPILKNILERLLLKITITVNSMCGALKVLLWCDLFCFLFTVIIYLDNLFFWKQIISVGDTNVRYSQKKV